MRVFTISGKARHGKSTVADYIKEYYERQGQKVCIIPLARHIKNYARDFFGWDGQEENKPRDLFNELGTDIIRIKMKKQLFHIDRITEDIEVLANYFDIFVIPDARLILEVEEFKKRFNAINIRVNRPHFESELTNNQKNHITETELDHYSKFDYYLENNDTLDALKDKVYELMRVIK